MSDEASSQRDRRRSLDELEPDLRQRLIALDEPVARNDWQDVLKRSRKHRPFSIRNIAIAAAMATGALAVASGVALHIRSDLTGSSGREASNASLATSPRTPRPHTALGPTIPASTTIEIGDNPERRLYVSLSKKGFCYRWKNTLSECQEHQATPLHVSWNNGQLAGSISSKRFSSVQIKFTDGTVTAPAISWIAGPVNAGFFLYQIPPGKFVADITGYQGHQTLGQVTWYSL